MAKPDFCLAGQIIVDEIRQINAANERHINTGRFAAHKEKYNRYKLAEAMVLDPALLHRYLCGKRMSLHTIMRAIAVIGPSEAKATEIIHAAGYDISTDGLQDNAAYRQLIALGPGQTEAKNEILTTRSRPGIIRAFVRY